MCLPFMHDWKQIKQEPIVHITMFEARQEGVRYTFRCQNAGCDGIRIKDLV